MLAMIHPLASVFPLLLVAVSILLVASHLSARRRAERRELEADQRDFLARQFRRRMQASVMIGLLGLALLAGVVFPWANHPLAFAIYWIIVIVFTLWLIALAAADAISSTSHFRQQALEHRIHRAKLEALLARHKEHGRGGELGTAKPGGSQ